MRVTCPDCGGREQFRVYPSEGAPFTLLCHCYTSPALATYPNAAGEYVQAHALTRAEIDALPDDLAIQAEVERA